MTDDVEQLLSQLTPRGVRAEVRPRVLGAVEAELAAPAASPWARRAALAVAASLLVGVALNVYAGVSSKRQLARLFGPPPVSRRAMELAKVIEEVTDRQTAQWLCQRMAAPRPASPDDLARHYATVQQLIRELESPPKGSYHETPEEDPEMDGHRPRRVRGDTSYRQRDFCLDYRYPA
jgi:hypothetical protein